MWSHNLPATPLTEAWGDKAVLREKETKNSRNHTISCLNVFMCFVFDHSGQEINERED